MKASIAQMREQAAVLGYEGTLYDPSDDNILIYAAEALGDFVTDLSAISDWSRRSILNSYAKGERARAASHRCPTCGQQTGDWE